jgi:hypothetical protein
MNKSDRIQLEKMIRENDVQDCTNDIREKKHSELIRNDVTTMIDLKKKYARLNLQGEQFDQMLINRCSFLFNNYTDIFNKVKKNEINLATLWELLNVLKKIEDSELDQHEGSYEVGKLLKQIYIDGSLMKAERLDKKNKISKTPNKKPKKLSYKEFKLKDNHNPLARDAE